APTPYGRPPLGRAPGGDELVGTPTPGADAYDPKTGRLLWWVGEPHRFAVPVPAAADGTIYLSRGYRSGPYMAVRAGGRGDVSKTHVLWSFPTGAPYIASLLYYDGLLYMANDAGIVTCLDPKTGEKVWQGRSARDLTAPPL